MPLGPLHPFRGKRILVTGATGFVGRHLCVHLQAAGAHVVALIRKPQYLPYDSALASLEDFRALERAVVEKEIELIFHLGAQTLVGIAQKLPMQTFESNIRGTYHILEMARRHHIAKTLIASSDKAYGSSDHLPYSETHPLQGRYPYDVSKSCADLLAQSYAQSYGLSVVITRCANLFGPGDRHLSRLIPGTIHTLLKGDPIQLRSNGQAKRDYLYIDDAIAGLCLAMQKGGPGEAYNFGLNEPRSALSIVTQIRDMLGLICPIKTSDEPLKEIYEQALSSEKAHTELGWRAHTAFEKGLTATLEWARAHLLDSETACYSVI